MNGGGGGLPNWAYQNLKGDFKPAQNWLTDPNAPWNTWAQNLEGYLQDWVSAQREGLLADLQQQNVAAGQRAIGQGLYTGTYTSSLPAENLAKMMSQNAQGYAGALSGLQSSALAQLMQGQQQYGSQMLAATLAELQRKAEAEAQGFGLGDIFGGLVTLGANVIPAVLTGGTSLPATLAATGAGMAGIGGGGYGGL